MNEPNPYITLLGLILLIAIPVIIIKYKIWIVKKGTLNALREHENEKEKSKSIDN